MRRPNVLLHEPTLGAMEFAKQNQLERIAVRLAPIESMPPQLQGVLPLDFSDESAYQGGLETLLGYFLVYEVQPEAELPAEILTAVYSENPQIRRNAIQSLLEYRSSGDETMKRLAREELNALVFRERDSAVKNLVRTAVQIFDQEERPETRPNVDIPTKEELAKQAEGRAVIIEEPKTMHFWETNRWYVVLGIIGIVLGVVLVVIGGHVAYLIPSILVGLVLPYLNVMIRQGGEFDWKMPGPVLGNAFFALIVAGIAAVILMLAVEELKIGFVVVNITAGLIFGIFIGWLSAVEIEL